MKMYLDVWFFVTMAITAASFVIGLWTTFAKEGKSYTRREMFGEDVNAWMRGIVGGVIFLTAVCNCRSLVGVVMDSVYAAWLGASTVAALIILAITLTDFATYVMVRGAFYFGYVVKSAIVELQCRHWDEQQEIAAGVQKLVTEDAADGVNHGANDQI